jgi:hypothetical protein
VFISPVPRTRSREKFPRFQLSDASPDVSTLRNLGPRSTALLASIGIRTRADLVRHGALGACKLLIDAGHRISLNLVCAIEGALMDCDWRDIPHDFRLHLVTEFRQLQEGRRHRQKEPILLT